CRRRRSPGADVPQGGGLAARNPERGRRLGRGRRKLQARLPGLRAVAEYRLANGMGLAWPDGSRRGRTCGGWTRDRISGPESRQRWALGRGAVHRNRLSSRVLFAVSRLSEILSALGDGALS